MEVCELMMTNITVNNELIAKAISVSEFKTKREVAEKAISEFIENRTRKDLSELKGKIKFAENYDYKSLREGKLK